MKKFMILVLVAVMSVFIMGFNTKAAEREKSDYELVCEGVDKDFQEMKEEGTEDEYVISIKKYECVSEQVTTWTVKEFSDGETHTIWIYVNGMSQEVYAVWYDADGDVIDGRVMNLWEAADYYR